MGNRLGDLAQGSVDLPVAKTRKLRLDRQGEAEKRNRNESMQLSIVRGALYLKAIKGWSQSDVSFALWYIHST